MVLSLILNYNGLAMTRDCCAALARQTAASELRVLVVENGSKANTAEELAAACPNAEVVHTPVNLGFSGGIAFGLAHGKAAQLPFDWLWLLNNDTIPSSTALAALLATGASLPSVGAVGCPLSAAPDRGSPQHASMRMRPPFYVPRPGTPPDYLCGASLLISRRAFEKLGPPDVAFPFFFEDADWGFRARAAGFTLALAPEARIVHLGSATIGSLGRARAALYREGYVRFLRRHARHPFLASIPATAWRVVADLFRLRFADVGGTLSGWRKGWRGAMPPPAPPGIEKAR